MKKIFLAIVSVLAMSLGTVSCSDKETDPADKGNGGDTTAIEKPDTTAAASDSADYTVIYWGMAGKLDPYTISDFGETISNIQKGTTGKNVNLVGRLKTSLSLSGATTWKDNTYEFHTPVNPDSLLGDDFRDLPTKDDQYKAIFAALNGKVVGDTEYRLDNADSLAAFIKRSAKDFPARHYVLMLSGHGDGFTACEDCVPATRGTVDDSFLDMRLALDNLVKGVKDSGVKIQTLFLGSCLMGALENMAAYSQVFDYSVLSAETVGPYIMAKYISGLSEAAGDEAKMKQKTIEAFDLYAARNLVLHTSYGLYDLRKMPELLSVAKEAATWFADNYADEASISAINRALGQAVYYDAMDVTETKKRDVVRKYLYEGEDKSATDRKAALTEVFSDWSDLLQKNSDLNGFIFADVMRQAMKAQLPQEKTAQLQDIYNRYLSALKDMAYIKVTNKPENAIADYEYIYASPTVNIYSLHPDYYLRLFTAKGTPAENVSKLVDAIIAGDEATAQTIRHQMLEGSSRCVQRLEAATKFYQMTLFDQQVGWSKFMQKLKFNPNRVTNPDRQFVSENK